MQILDSEYAPFDPVYATFRERALAAIIDWLILGLLGGLVWLLSFGWIETAIVGLAYYAILESSSRQATFGKQAAGLIVTDLDGHRINILQALGRYLVRLISYGIFFLGLFLMFFTERRQCLHDIVTGTVVVKRPDA